MYAFGLGVEQSDGEAYRWFLKSADLQFANGQEFIGEFYYYGIFVEKDIEKAFGWFSLAAEQGNALAQAHLGEIYDNYAPLKDLKKSFNWRLKAASQLNPNAMFLIVFMLCLHYF